MQDKVITQTAGASFQNLADFEYLRETVRNVREEVTKQITIVGLSGIIPQI